MYFCCPQLGVRRVFSHNLTFLIHDLSCVFGDSQLFRTWLSQRCFVLKGLLKKITFRTLYCDNFSCFTPRNPFSYINNELASISCSGEYLPTFKCFDLTTDYIQRSLLGLSTFATEVCYWITLRDCPLLFVV